MAGMVVLNPSDKPVIANIKGKINGIRKVLMGTVPVWKVNKGNTQIQMAAKSYSVIKRR